MGVWIGNSGRVTRGRQFIHYGCFIGSYFMASGIHDTLCSLLVPSGVVYLMIIPSISLRSLSTLRHYKYYILMLFWWWLRGLVFRLYFINCIHIHIWITIIISLLYDVFISLYWYFFSCNVSLCWFIIWLCFFGLYHFSQLLEIPKLWWLLWCNYNTIISCLIITIHLNPFPILIASMTISSIISNYNIDIILNNLLGLLHNNLWINWTLNWLL